LGSAQTRRGARAARPPNRVQPQSLEGVQIGVGGVDMNLHEAGDVGGGDASRMEDQGLGTATLPGL